MGTLTLHREHDHAWIDRGDGQPLVAFDDSPLGNLLLGATLIALTRQGKSVCRPDGSIVAGDVLATV